MFFYDPVMTGIDVNPTFRINSAFLNARFESISDLNCFDISPSPAVKSDLDWL